MGNMLTDSRNGLEFSYNLANLPENVEGTGGASLTYQYLSDGSKWRASANDGPSILYRGSFVYENDGTSTRISSIAWDQGRISYHYAPEPEPGDSLAVEFGEGVIDSLVVMDSLVVEDGICDEWHVRDHLGSVRAIAGIGNYITGVRELNTYLPFGTRIPGSIQAADNRHRFGGKEEQRYGTFNLGLSDFGARYYDPYSCRWTTRDPMAGKYLSLSPYNYCAGNPVNMVDPEGSVIGNIIGALVGAGSDYIGQVAVNAAVNISNGKSLKGILTKNIDLADIGIAAIEGFFTSGASAGKTFSKKGAKVLVSAIAGAVAGAVDYTVEKGPETGSAQSVITGAVAGTLAGSADPGIKTKNVMTNTSSNKATNKAKEEALNKGHRLPTEEAKRIAAKNSANNSEKAAINNAINNSVNDAVMSSTKWFNNYIWMMEKEQQNQ